MKTATCKKNHKKTRRSVVNIRHDLLDKFHEDNKVSLSQILNQLLEQHLIAKDKQNEFTE